MSPQRTRAVARDSADGVAYNSLRLRILGSDHERELADEQTTIGSDPDNDVVLSDPYVSKRHCRLFKGSRGELWIEDGGSRNGTWVNNVRVQQCVVQNGARIIAGHTSLQLLHGKGAPEPGPCGIVGEHPSMQRVFAEIARYGATLHSVLITGETGTGKELVARALHQASPCRFGPFEALNCAAIPRELAENELFGHDRGAFTGAERPHDGAFGRADGGTLFLDEIGDMPLDLQPKLLRALEERAIHPVGAAQRRQVAIRVVAATHRDLQQEAAKHRFRLDLFHRLAVGVIQLPALRTRRSDIRLLAQHFIEELDKGPTPVSVESDVWPLLEQQDWPGNVRALRHSIERAILLGGSHLTRADFPGLVDRGVRPVEASVADAVQIAGRSFSDIRRDVYIWALRENGGNRSAAAAALGVPKSTFFDHLRTMRLDPKDYR